MPTRRADDAVGGVTMGTIYLIKSGRHYKIGKTYSLMRRESEIGRQRPDAYEIIHHFQTDDPDGIEKYWHERFKGKELGHEFFALKREDIQAFQRRKKFM